MLLEANVIKYVQPCSKNKPFNSNVINNAYFVHLT